MRRAPVVVTWYQQNAGMRIEQMMTPDEFRKPTFVLTDLGIVAVTDYPAYDNGFYYVVDTVHNLEWTVVSRQGTKMRSFPLDKYEAIRYADELAESDQRNPDV